MLAVVLGSFGSDDKQSVDEVGERGLGWGVIGGGGVKRGGWGGLSFFVSWGLGIGGAEEGGCWMLGCYILGVRLWILGVR